MLYVICVIDVKYVLIFVFSTVFEVLCLLCALGNYSISTYFVATLGILEGQCWFHEMILSLLSREKDMFPSSDTSDTFHISCVSSGGPHTTSLHVEILLIF